MKKIFVYLLALCSVVACSKYGGEETFEPYLQIRPESIEFGTEGGEIDIQILANFDYEITPNIDWITVEPTKQFWVKVTAEASQESKKRSGQITITNKQYNIKRAIMVSQKAFVEDEIPTPPALPTINTSGWAEMPTMVTNLNWEYGIHDKLPSNKKLRNYSFCFDREKFCALWVAYPLHECYTEGGGKRTNAWSYDPCCIADEYEPNLYNAYYPKGGSSYSHSRGHQLPSADRLASNEDNATTFYFTNMTPQLQSLNGASWESLESDLRGKWMCSDTLYVVTGAHFEPGYGYAYDNKGNGKACAVPTHYYKVILRTKKGNSGKWVGNCSANELQCVGFWFEHKGGAARQTMSVAEIEKKTGHTFFPNVPNAPKDKYNSSEW